VRPRAQRRFARFGRVARIFGATRSLAFIIDRSFPWVIRVSQTGSVSKTVPKVEERSLCE